CPGRTRGMRYAPSWLVIAPATVPSDAVSTALASSSGRPFEASVTKPLTEAFWARSGTAEKAARQRMEPTTRAANGSLERASDNFGTVTSNGLSCAETNGQFIVDSR